MRWVKAHNNQEMWQWEDCRQSTCVKKKAKVNMNLTATYGFSLDGLCSNKKTPTLLQWITQASQNNPNLSGHGKGYLRAKDKPQLHVFAWLDEAQQLQKGSRGSVRECGGESEREREANRLKEGKKREMTNTTTQRRQSVLSPRNKSRVQPSSVFRTGIACKHLFTTNQNKSNAWDRKSTRLNSSHL